MRAYRVDGFVKEVYEEPISSAAKDVLTFMRSNYLCALHYPVKDTDLSNTALIRCADIVVDTTRFTLKGNGIYHQESIAKMHGVKLFSSNKDVSRDLDFWFDGFFGFKGNVYFKSLSASKLVTHTGISFLIRKDMEYVKLLASDLPNNISALNFLEELNAIGETVRGNGIKPVMPIGPTCFVQI